MNTYPIIPTIPTRRRLNARSVKHLTLISIYCCQFCYWFVWTFLLVPEEVKVQYEDNIKWIEGAQQHHLVSCNHHYRKTTEKMNFIDPSQMWRHDTWGQAREKKNHYSSREFAVDFLVVLNVCALFGCSNHSKRERDKCYFWIPAIYTRSLSASCMLN